MALYILLGLGIAYAIVLFLPLDYDCNYGNPLDHYKGNKDDKS